MADLIDQSSKDSTTEEFDSMGNATSPPVEKPTENTGAGSDDQSNTTPMEVSSGAEEGHAESSNSPEPTAEKNWYDLQFHDKAKQSIKKPHELQQLMTDPPKSVDEHLYNKVAGSMVGMALGDALGAHVEFRPHEYLQKHPVTDLSSGGTWGLNKGQFTDDTSMALCLATSLIACQGFNLYDQLVRYKWWYRHGYMSSTGECFDIGAATRQSLEIFKKRQGEFVTQESIPSDQIDSLSDPELIKEFDVYCSQEGVAGNGALMRLAPVPLFFHQHPLTAVEYSGQSGQVTHGDQKAYDACRYYAALIVAALQGEVKDQLLDNDFYEEHQDWFSDKELHPDILSIAHGSYKKEGGYKDGIRGGGYIVRALEAALWAFWSHDDFEAGALAAVNLGDDTDTTAAIYGQLAGAFYGLSSLPPHWLEHVYAKEFLLKVSGWLIYEGKNWYNQSPTTTEPSNKINPDERRKKWEEKKQQEKKIAMSELNEEQLNRIASSDFYKQFHGDDFHRPLQIMITHFADRQACRVNLTTRVKQWQKNLPSGIDQGQVELIHHFDRYEEFLERMLALQHKQHLPTDLPLIFHKDISPSHQELIRHRWTHLRQQTKYKHHQDVCVIRGWYGCSHEKMLQIQDNGFTHSVKLGEDENDKGVCLKASAYAAAQHAGQEGCVIMCYMILHHPFVTIIGNASSAEVPNRYRVYSDGHHSAYQVEYQGGQKDETSIMRGLPSDEVEEGLHDELVSDAYQDILPQVVIYLKSQHP